MVIFSRTLSVTARPSSFARRRHPELPFPLGQTCRLPEFLFGRPINADITEPALIVAHPPGHPGKTAFVGTVVFRGPSDHRFQILSGHPAPPKFFRQFSPFCRCRDMPSLGRQPPRIFYRMPVVESAVYPAMLRIVLKETPRGFSLFSGASPFLIGPGFRGGRTGSGRYMLAAGFPAHSTSEDRGSRGSANK